MKLEIYDQFEFDEWESESFLVIASERKGLRGADYRVKSINDFFRLSDSQDCFKQWQTEPFEKAKKLRLSDESECVVSISEVCEEIAGFIVCANQEVYMRHGEWNLVDFLWESDDGYYRVMWCMSA